MGYDEIVLCSKCPAEAVVLLSGGKTDNAGHHTSSHGVEKIQLMKER